MRFPEYRATTSSQIDSARLGAVVFASLLIAGSLTASSTLWYVFDPWLLSNLHVHWLTIHTIYCLVAAAMFLDLCSRTLPPSSWPWKLLLSWLPIALWSAARSLWSVDPRTSWYIWGLEILMGAVAMVWGYTIGYRRLPTANSLKAVLLGILIYVALRALLADAPFEYARSTTWFCMVFVGLLWWLADECNCPRPKPAFFLLLILIIAVQELAIKEIPERMYMLSLLFTTIVAGVLFAGLSIEPKNRYVWRGALAAIGVLFASLFYSLASVRPSSYLGPSYSGVASGADHWYSVLFNSERYVLFGFWLHQGMQNLWTGVGLGPFLPAMAYREAIAAHPVLKPMLTHAHNYFIDVWLQLGIVGLLLMLYWMRTALVHATRGFGAMGQGHKRAAVGLILLFVAVFARNLADDGFHADNVFVFWLSIGIILGLQRVRRDELRGNDITGDTAGCTSPHPIREVT